MDIIELKDRAALIAFKELLQRHEHQKDEDIEAIAFTAWLYAEKFMDNRPMDKAASCSLERMVPEKDYSLTGGAGPRTAKPKAQAGKAAKPAKTAKAKPKQR
jgi:hypothetical protein